MQPFRKLANTSGYRACDWDIARDDAARAHWVGFFKRHFETILKLAAEIETRHGANLDELPARLDRARRQLHGKLDRFNADPHGQGVVTMLHIDRWRDEALRDNRIHDAFDDVKRRENERMLPVLPTVCRQLDAIIDPADQFRALIEGIFAGNIFDMGAEATAKAFLGQSPDFFSIRRSLAPRPWLVDDYDALAGRMLEQVHRHAMFFIDNAGSDFLLGALPFIRWMSKRGTRVSIVANESPTLNDMTIHDVRRWWPEILRVQPDLADARIELVSSGTGDPLIDLSAVSDELNRAAAHADFVILEGMGRGVESNLDADFTCDALNIAMIKDPIIARQYGGKVFDLVCRFR